MSKKERIALLMGKLNSRADDEPPETAVFIYAAAVIVGALAILAETPEETAAKDAETQDPKPGDEE